MKEQPTNQTLAHNGTETSSACFTLRPVGRPRARTRRRLPAAKRETRKREDAGAERLGSSIVNVRQTDRQTAQKSEARLIVGQKKTNNTVVLQERRFWMEKHKPLADLFSFQMDNSVSLEYFCGEMRRSPTKSHVDQPRVV